MSEDGILHRVGYPKPVGIIMLVLGLLSLGLGIAVGVMTGRVNIASIIPGLICCLMAPAYMSKPFFWIESDAVVMPALLGPVKKRHDFRYISDLSVRDGKLYVKEKKITGKFMANKVDWAALEQLIENARAKEAF
ncbi:MAG: hypothetical protein ACE366_07160 [Bradymonadia bacterium]